MINYIWFAFIVKHFLADFPLQTFYQLTNKGKYGHPGGVLHAGMHGIFTLFICFSFGIHWWFAVIDAAVHYHVDWLKMQYRYKPDNKIFWWLLGLDQMAHYLTYLFIISYGA